jgi:hypothetical protein
MCSVCASLFIVLEVSDKVNRHCCWLYTYLHCHCNTWSILKSCVNILECSLQERLEAHTMKCKTHYFRLSPDKHYYQHACTQWADFFYIHTWIVISASKVQSRQEERNHNNSSVISELLNHYSLQIHNLSLLIDYHLFTLFFRFRIIFSSREFSHLMLKSKDCVGVYNTWSHLCAFEFLYRQSWDLMRNVFGIYKNYLNCHHFVLQ